MVVMGIVVTVGILFSLSCAQKLEMGDPPELAAYIAEIRANRTSASAEMRLRQASALITRDVIVSVKRDDSTGIWHRVSQQQGTRCLAPGADSLAVEQHRLEVVRQRREEEERVALVMVELRKLADEDRSGFVSDQEGEKLSQLIEFGYLVDSFLSARPTPKSEMPPWLSAEGILARISKFNTLAERFNAGQEHKLPKIPAAGAIKVLAEGSFGE
jgi:hypothetical protein